MLLKRSGVTIETSTPIFASSRLVFSIERTTPLTCGCQASVTITSLSGRFPAAAALAQLSPL
ncbi:hypothetical protein ACOJBO_28265 [Rhizobium beringeri]